MCQCRDLVLDQIPISPVLSVGPAMSAVGQERMQKEPGKNLQPVEQTESSLCMNFPPIFLFPMEVTCCMANAAPKIISRSSSDCLGAGKGVRSVSFPAGAGQGTRDSEDLTSTASAATAAAGTWQQGWGWCLRKNDKSEKRFHLTFLAKLSPSPKATQLVWGPQEVSHGEVLLAGTCEGVFRREVLVMVKATLQIFIPGFIFSLAGFCTFPCRQRHSP